MKLVPVEPSEVDVRHSQSIIGSLLYLAVTPRPTSARHVRALKILSSNPASSTYTRPDMSASTYGARRLWQSNASHMSDPYTSKGHGGHLFTIAGGPVTWLSKRLPLVTTSSAETEYVAAARAAQAAVYLRQLLQELGFDVGTTPLHMDSQSAMCIATNPVAKGGSKHIRLRYHLLRELIGEGVVKAIYVQPPAVDGIFSPNTVQRLKRGLYGLKQSPRLWNHTLDAWMREQDFVATATDACIYRRTCKGGKVMWVAVYVDDLLIFADSDSDMAAFKKAISKRFKMKDLGSPDICLGIKVQHDRKARTVTMSQEHYLRNVLETFGMVDCKPFGTPLCTGYVDRPADKGGATPGCAVPRAAWLPPYAATMTLKTSRRLSPCCLAACSILAWNTGRLPSTFFATSRAPCPTPSTAAALPTACSQRTRMRRSPPTFDTRRSRTGFVVFCSTGPVSWNSKLQATVATASADAEYMALAATAQELMFLRQLQEELTGAALCEPTLVHTDNQPAQRVAEHAASRMRHILVKYHYIRECVDTKRIVLSYLATEHMIADLLTKILPRPKTAQFCTMLFDQRPLPGCQPRARPHSGRSPRPSTPRQDL
ncbi:hypothetical protein PTSG_12008 [Salpingoeca rosetta]|uniref:Reverse transcriptase Ty1/copia-type domain-containing protein n=2 Tax=Salpingoeca rosetta (strain ATCC 50818 / BSB-021) TaxID=946362 RepID=F2U4Z8_SALR5|nr:uncharacterized protein PTSG_12008 [Salpingoeca rosetta]EGD82714.1 hypothetical protein PTSG_12008 [Salpingoeca rosetta]|eukprot:XP_004995950.1 hypothetical protein PTSG_12008 [Salpingoeca rosetta]